MITKYIVFYGSLKKGKEAPVRSTIAQSFKYRSECTILGELYAHGKHPALKEGTRLIRGELYEILDDAALPILDQYESPNYTRTSIRVLQPPLDAWIYYFNGKVSGYQLIEANRWE